MQLVRRYKWIILAVVGGSLAAAAEIPRLPGVVWTSGETVDSILRLVCGVVGFTIYFSFGFLQLRAATLAAFVFAACFHLATLHWLYDGAIAFFGTGTINLILTPLFVTGFIALLSLPYMAVTAVQTCWTDRLNRLPGIAPGIGRVAKHQAMTAIAVIATPVFMIGGIAVGHQLVFGFAWFEFGQWLIDFEILHGVIRLTGARWAGLVPLGAASILAYTIVHSNRFFWIASCATVLCITLALGSSVANLGDSSELRTQLTAFPHPTNMRIAVIAAPKIQGFGRGPRERISAYMAETIRLISATSSEQPIDLIVWPESVASTEIHRVAPALKRVLADRGIAADLWLGARESANDKEEYNTIYSVTGRQTLYRKRKLVPFTETMPAPQQFFAWWMLDFLQLQPRNHNLLAADVNADRFTWQSSSGPLHIFPLICYETAFAHMQSPKHEPHANALILNAGNEAWFRNETLHRYTLRQARTRAIEFARPVLRVVRNGYSGFLDARGRPVSIFREQNAVIKIPVTAVRRLPALLPTN